MNSEKDGIFTSIVRFIKYNVNLVLIIVFFIGLISMTIFGNKGVLQKMKLEEETREIENLIKLELVKTENLQKEIDALSSSDKRLEEVAREKFGMTKDGEKIYKVIIDSTE
ncbi:MAG TPA: septum formation initiator family protein [Ignavibacteria bacterium]|nr:septum formation initiator family protein [Ignavibacteria bacterium]HQY53165.1 septum formation initiator family protein [Ignavibacteria bacterium]HRB01183.1 septum formation initiator family protein [Ignavibacteria bacterium]